MTFKTSEQRELIYNTQREDFFLRTNEEIKNLEIIIEQNNRKERADRVLNPKHKKK